MNQFLTSKRAKFGPVFNVTAYLIYLFIYLFCVFFVCVSFLPQEQGNTQTILTPTHSWDNPEELFMYIVLFSPR